MLKEITSAVNIIIYILTLQPKKIKQVKIKKFKRNLIEYMSRVYKETWDCNKPYRGSSYRRLEITNRKLSPVILLAFARSNIGLSKLNKLKKLNIIIFVDPGQVQITSGRNDLGFIYNAALGSKCAWENQNDTKPGNHFNIGIFKKLSYNLNKRFKITKQQVSEALVLDFNNLSL
jgi:hypothetical protein